MYVMTVPYHALSSVSQNLISNYFLWRSIPIVPLRKRPSKMSDSPARPMKYPYTFTAKIAQFPFKFYVQNQWIWRYWMLGIAVASPVIYKIHKMANSPENVSMWAEKRRKEAAAHHH